MSPTDLRSIRTFPSLVKYLRDELDWPIETDDFDDLTFDYRPEELGIDPKTAASIEEIKQLRPLVANQPWGIFFIKFEPKRLPVVVLRRILRTLVIKKRASAIKSHQATWNLHDLLFISSYGESDHRDITFAHFTEDDQVGDLPALRVLGWDDEDTVLHLEHAHKVLREKLRWPSDPHQADEWSEQWSSAFTLRHMEVITTSKDLAIQLARLATAIRKRVSKVLSIESEDGPLRKLMNAFKQALIHDLYEEAFADMYAQTITYGLLSARVSRPAALVAENITDMVPTTNPFLKDLLSTFLTVGGRKGKIDFDELGINEVVHALRNANMEAVLRDFGDRNPQEDPVIHFYELFLKEYNPKLRMQRGVFYTPKPIVSFIVRSVDEILCTEFGLEDGLADTTTWGEMLKRLPEVKLPKDTEPKEPFVQILDPALGTGTFLVEVIDIIHKTMITKWQKAGYSISKQQQLWNEYVPKHLLPRLYGFELLMAPYTIAHMKIGLKLWETGYRFGSDERAHIYLTNSLEPAVDIQMDLPDLLPALAHEAQAANSVKRHKRFTVVIGNPPYSGISANRNDWIETLLKGRDLSGRKTANYYEVNGASIGEKKVWLQDDYVKFVRLSHFLIEEAGMGVHGMITNHSFVDSPTCRGLRFQLARFFSVMHFVDLHGSTKKSEVAPEDIIDENVFDILPGVAVSLCARASLSRHMTIGSFDLWGTREDKFTWLLGHSMDSVHWMPLSLSEPYYLFVNRQLDFDAEYYGFYSLKDIFSFYGTGVQTSRDEFATDYVRKDLEDRLCAFFSREQSDKTIGEKFGVSDTRGWKIREIRRTSNFAKVSEHITQYLFRIFDTKWVALTKDIVDWPRFDVISCVGPNRPGLLCSRQQATPGFRHAFVVNMPVDMFCISNKSREGQTVFPLFACTEGSFFQSKSDTKWKLNFGQQFAEDSFRLLHPSVTHGECKSLSEEDGFQILAYLYAILHSAIYRARYVDLLKMDYPRLPLTSNMKLFITLARLGGELITLHLIESPKVNRYITKFLGDENPEVEKIFYSDSTVWIDKAQTIGFKGVPEDVWNFHIGGYQVCEKWLKDRKGRRLTKDDIEHYQKIVVALNETIRLMTEIDKVIEKHGGWPGAFNTSNICETE